MTDTYEDLQPLLARMQLEQIPNSDRPEQRQVFGLPASCPRCAGAMTLINTTANEVLSVAIMRCTPCRREWEITCRIGHHAVVR